MTVRPDGPQVPAAQLRRERRAFVAAHHPDRGGDPAAFAAGLARLDARLAVLAALEDRPRVTGVRRTRGLRGVVQRLQARRRRRHAPPRVR